MSRISRKISIRIRRSVPAQRNKPVIWKHTAKFRPFSDGIVIQHGAFQILRSIYGPIGGSASRLCLSQRHTDYSSLWGFTLSLRSPIGTVYQQHRAECSLQAPSDCILLRRLSSEHTAPATTEAHVGACSALHWYVVTKCPSSVACLGGIIEAQSVTNHLNQPS